MNKRELNRLIENLPESPNILGKDRYFNSAVLVPLVIIGEEYYLLFQKRAPGIRQGDEICFPGGMFDPEKDRDFKEAALRETYEELGISQEMVSVKGQLDTLVASAGVTVDSFVGVADIRYPEDIKLNRDEVEKTFILPVSHFIDNPPKIYSVRLQVEPGYTSREGEKITLLPSKELGLPERYHKPWGGLRHRVLVYNSEEGIIWGITAEIINDLINKL